MAIVIMKKKIYIYIYIINEDSFELPHKLKPIFNNLINLKKILNEWIKSFKTTLKKKKKKKL